MKVSFTVPGAPVGKGRPRFVRAGEFVRTYTPDKTITYENLVKVEFERQCGRKRFERGVNVSLGVTAYYAIPKNTGQKKRELMNAKKIRPVVRPDVDNILKIICDGLNGIAYNDDAQIVESTIRKYYSDEPRVVVTLKEVEPRGKD